MEEQLHGVLRVLS